MTAAGPTPSPRSPCSRRRPISGLLGLIAVLLPLLAAPSCSDEGPSSTGGSGVSITTTALPSAVVGVAYSQTLTATGGSGAYAWSVTAGALPAGLALNGTTGAISGTSNAVATASFTVRVTSDAQSDTRPMSLTVLSAPSQADPEPMFSPTTGTIVHQNNMDGYTTATAAGALPLGSAPRIAPVRSPVATSKPVDESEHQVVSPGHGGTGKALRILYDGTYQGGPEWVTLNDPPTSNSATQYFTFWARITYPGGTSAFLASKGHAIAVKWFMAWHNVRTGDRIQWNTHKNYPCPIGPNGANPLNNATTYWQIYDGSTETQCQAMQPIGPYFQNLVDGSWHRYTMQYKSNSAAGARDGFARMWIDGTKVIDVSKAACGVTPTGGEKPWCGNDDLDALYVADGIDHVIWGGPDTEGDIAPWTLDFDDFMWWTTR